jgi:hypothetical protein
LVYKYFAQFFLILTLATLACASPFSKPASVQEATLAPTVTAPELTTDQLKNAQYRLGAREDFATVQLTDGQYQQGTDTTTMDYARVALTDFVAIGDLTGDGVAEAAAIVFENYGGTGNFAFLTIFTNVNGQPVFLYSTMIDDRPMIKSITIDNGEVHLDAVTHGFEDPACCPALPTTRRYVLANNTLRVMNYTTATTDGAKRIIEITSPANGTDATGNLQLTGTVSIAPFENNLSYFIYDEAGNQLLGGPVMVTAPDFGAPGTFDQSISLEGIPAGTTIYLEIQDVSAADGSLLALDAVKLIVK